MAARLIVKDLVKHYGDVQAVRGVSFEVNDGEIFGLLGPNGAGKTSTVECIIGLRQPDSGTIELCGIDSRAHPGQVRQHIGVALQSTALQDKITPREALSLFGSFYARRAPVESLIKRFSLEEKADAPFDALSGGQRQRLALALAFVNEPEVLFLDEPTTGLDPQSRRELRNDILQMRAEGHTVVLTTHYLEEAHALCDRVAIIDHGTVIAMGKPDELIAKSKESSRISVTTSRPMDQATLAQLNAVKHVEIDGLIASITTKDVSKTVIAIVKLIEAMGHELTDIQIQRSSLEDAFIELTRD